MPRTTPKSKFTWSQYKIEARKIKAAKPNTTPSQIINQLGYPHKFGKQIRITSNGFGGVKERNVPSHRARDIQRQIRLRIQTGKLSKEENQAVQQEKKALRAQGLEVDHINESWLLGEQLEALRDSGGEEAVQSALTRLKNAGYSVGNQLGNLQGLTPEENKQKYQQTKALQEYLGSREQLGQSPSAKRPDLIQTGYKPPELGGYQVEQPGVIVTGGSARFKPQKLEGFATDASVPSQLPVTSKQDLSEPILTFDTTPKPVDPVTTAIAVGGGIVLSFSEAVKSAIFGIN